MKQDNIFCVEIFHFKICLRLLLLLIVQENLSLHWDLSFQNLSLPSSSLDSSLLYYLHLPSPISNPYLLPHKLGKPPINLPSYLSWPPVITQISSHVSFAQCCIGFGVAWYRLINYSIFITQFSSFFFSPQCCTWFLLVLNLSAKDEDYILNTIM